MTVRIVADSTSDVPDELAIKLNIAIVPAYVNVGDRSYLEKVELSRREFYENLAAYPDYPTTAAPSSGAFASTYERLASEGATEIVSIHIASTLSATYNAARLGAKAIDAVPVTIFDTKQITAGAGLLVILAAEAAIAGIAAEKIVQMLEERVARTRVFGMINDLSALRKSGRVSWASFGLGTLLQIKPVMMIRQGEISVVAKIRTRARATLQMLDMIAEFAPFERMAVIHVNAPEAAEALRLRAEHLLPKDQATIVANITPAIGTHLGLGATGFACISSPISSQT
jgi:DegV family protein with EDD domain